MTRIPFVVLLALLLAGCAVGPEFARPDAKAPTRWSDGTGDERPPRDNWWRDFRDPVLDALIADAIDGNLTLASTKAKVREARAYRAQAVAALSPTLEGTASATGSHAQLGSETSIPFEAGFDASWELDLFGANARAAEAAAHDVEAVEYDLDDAVLTLLGDVVDYYVNMRGYEARIALARRTAASQRKTADLTRVQFNAGSSSGSDTAKADAQAASTEADIPDLEISRAEAVHRLAILTGKAPGAVEDRLGRSGVVPAPKAALVKSVPAKTIEARPDVRAAEARYAQYVAKLGEAQANLYPSVSLTGSIDASGTRPGDLFRASSISWSYGPSVTVPIFDGGSLRAARDAAAAQRDEYLVAWKSSVLTALEDVENAAVGLAQSRVKVGKLTEASANYQKASDLTLSLYRNGSSGFLDVLDAERSLYSAEDSLIQARVAVALDYVSLAKALGGGLGRRLDSSKPEVQDKDVGPHARVEPAALDR